MDLPPKLKADLEASKEDHEYDSWLLEDHPLRSHPTQCIPGLGAALAELYTDLKQHTAWYLPRALLLVSACFAFFHLSKTIPSLAKYAISRPESHVHHVHSEPGHWYVKCTFPSLDHRPSALTQSAAAGCHGFRSEIRLNEDTLQMGPVLSSPRKENNLGLHLESLAALLQPQRSESPEDSSTSSSGATRESKFMAPFFLILDVQSPLEEVYPVLVSELETVRQEGLLTSSSHGFVSSGQLTVVITTETIPESYLAGGSSNDSDIFWVSSQDPKADVTNGHLTPLRT